MNCSPVGADQVDSLIARELNASPYPWTVSKLKGSLNADADCCLIEHDGVVIGYWLVQRVLDEAELLNFVIFKPHQAKGFGYQALKKLCTELQNKGVKKLFLEVRESNVSAQALYQKAGFSVITNRPNYYPTGDYTHEGRTEDALILRRIL